MNEFLNEIQKTYRSVGDLLEKGLPREGLNRIQTVSENIRDHVIINYLKGVCYQETGQDEHAEEKFRQVVIEDPGFIAAAEALLFMPENHLSEGEKAYLGTLIALNKPENSSLKDIREKLKDITPVPLAPRKVQTPEPADDTPLFIKKESLNIKSENTTADSASKKEEIEEIGAKSASADILQIVREKEEPSVKKPKEPEISPEKPKETEDYLGDILVDSEEKDTEEESFESISNIRLSPEEEAEIEREERLEESEILADTEEASRLKELLKTLHERKQQDIETDEEEPQAEAKSKESSDSPELFNTLTMARIYFKQGAYSSALKILHFLKKNTTSPDKLKDIEALIKTVNEKIELEKADNT